MFLMSNSIISFSFVGCTPLHYAVRAGNPDITQVLTNYFTHYGLSLDTVNKDGKSPLQEAYHLGHTVCAKILLDATSSKTISSETEASTTAQDHRSHDLKNTTSEEVDAADAEGNNSEQLPPTSNEMTPPVITPRVEETRILSPGCVTITTTGSISSSQPASPKITESLKDGTTIVALVPSKTNVKNCLTTPEKSSNIISTQTSADDKVDNGRWATKPASLHLPVSTSTSLSALPLEISETFKGSHIPLDDEPEAQIRSPSVEKKEALRKMLTRRSAYVLNQMSKPNEWNVTQLIAPKAKDYRNDPEYMISVTNLAREIDGTDKKSPCRTPISSLPSGPNKKAKSLERPVSTWRNDIKKLFDHYEYHCSVSYRRPARLPEDSHTAGQSEGKDNETSHGGSGTGSSNVNTSVDRLNRRQRRSSNFSRSSAFTDPPNQRKMRSRRSSILSQQSSGIVPGVVRTGNAHKEYARTVSSDSTRSSTSSQKLGHA